MDRFDWTVVILMGRRYELGYRPSASVPLPEQTDAAPDLLEVPSAHGGRFLLRPLGDDDTRQVPDPARGVD